MAKKLKKYDEEKRLEDAAEWIIDFEGDDIKRAYCERYGVDVFATHEELMRLKYFYTGEVEDDKFEADNRAKSYMESQFEYIVGYTAGEVTFGTKKADNDIDKVKELAFETNKE
mgnify:FL=1